jgi:hypothetical protein
MRFNGAFAENYAEIFMFVEGNQAAVAADIWCAAIERYVGRIRSAEDINLSTLDIFED